MKRIYIFTAISYLLMMIFCTLVFSGCIMNKEPQTIHNPKIQLVLSASNDTTGHISNQQMEELKCYIDSIYTKQNSHYENALNDLRQESNNIINKWNGWFSFWIALLALLAGVIPLLVQMKVAHDNKEQLKDKFKELESQENLNEKRLEKFIESINYRVDLILKDFNNKNQDIRDGYDRFKLADIMNSFSVGWDNKLFTDCKERTILLDSVLTHLKKLFNEYIVCLKNNTEYNENQSIYLIELLILLHGILRKIYPLYTKNYKSRKVAQLIFYIECFITNISNKEIVDKKDIKRMLEEINDRFASLITVNTI